MKKRILAGFVLLSLHLSGCNVSTPQNTTAPLLSSTPNTEITTVTESTSATEYTEITETTEVTQPTEPTLSYKEQFDSYSVSTDFVATACWSKVLMPEAHSSISHCRKFTSGTVDASMISEISDGWCSSESTSNDCPKSFNELSAKYDEAFFKTHFLFIAMIYSADPPVIEKILYGEPMFFSNEMIIAYSCTSRVSAPPDVYHVFIEVPRTYLNFTEYYTIMWNEEIESLYH